MSVPNAGAPAAPALRATDHVVTADTALVVHGAVADVFAVDALGVRMPIASVSPGDVVFGAASPHIVIAVPRQEGSLAQIAPDQAPTTALAAFCAAVQADLGALAASLSAATAEDFPQALSTVIDQARSALDTNRATIARQSLAASEHDLQAAYARINWSAETLHTEITSLSDNPLVKVLETIGAVEGFTVVAPALEAIRSSADPLRLIAHASGVRYRSVALSPGWQANSQSSFLSAITGEGPRPMPVALLRSGRGYQLQRSTDVQPVPLTAELQARLVPQAFEFYAPITPNRAATRKDVFVLAMRGVKGQWLLAAGMALLIAVLGLLTPLLTNVVVGAVIPQGFTRLLIQIGLALVVAAGLSFVFSLVQNFSVSIISQRGTRSVQAAFWDRVLSLPASFFRDYSSGDLAVRVLAVDSLQSLISSQVVSAALAAVFGLVNLVLMFKYNVVLGLVGFGFLIVTVVVLLLCMRTISRYATASLNESKKANGWLVQMLSGIMKIRIAHAESRLAAQYLDIARRQNLALAGQTIVVGRISAWFAFAASGASALFYFAILVQWNGGVAPISAADYMAFASAYGMSFAAIAGLSSLISPIANAGPTFNLLAPIMEALPETAGVRQDPGKLQGRIELQDVHFRYNPEAPEVLKGLSFTVEPGKMVALVGPSGAGKSTITRLLLGFDAPESGQVLFDGRDINDLDPTMVRSQMGVVVQEGRITNGSILKNILGSVVQDEAVAWAAAEKAALADDIREMPMQMQTIVDPGNVSGGQAQRILLARALVRSPSILILDEATSALDNASQAIVTDAMQKLNATRIVIAHRLSTIKSADTIIVLEAGRAVEQGTFQELMQRNGVFASLVNRQVA